MAHMYYLSNKKLLEQYVMTKVTHKTLEVMQRLVAH